MGPTSAVKGTMFRDPNQTLRLLNLGYNDISDPGCLEVMYSINPSNRPGTAMSVNSEQGDPKKKGKKEKTEKVSSGKDNKIEKVILKHNPFTLGVHMRLLAEEKVEVQAGMGSTAPGLDPK